jgi:hypothetical protein
MSYENSILNGMKGGDVQYKDKSADKYHKKKKFKRSKIDTKSDQISSGYGQLSASRSSSSKNRNTKENQRDSSRVVTIANPNSSQSNNSSLNRFTNPMSHSKKQITSISQKQLASESEILQKRINDNVLLERLDEALTRDLIDKSSAQKVAICSKVWSEIIRREDPVISSLLAKIKQAYEHHIKSQNKTLHE